jgi:hypothetical protein
MRLSWEVVRRRFGGLSGVGAVLVVVEMLESMEMLGLVKVEVEVVGTMVV